MYRLSENFINPSRTNFARKMYAILFVILQIFGFSQSEVDLIDFNNFNLDLLDSLVFEEACKQREIYKSVPLIKDKLCWAAAKYQCDYMSFYNTAGHKNDKKFQGVLLKTVGERIDYFITKSKSNLNPHVKMEILIEMPGISKQNYIGFENKDYQTLSKTLIDYFMSSPHHKMALLWSIGLDFVQILGNFNTLYNKKTDTFYITVVIICNLSL